MFTSRGAVKTSIAALLAVTLLAGCSSARKTVYLPDGRDGFMTACEDDGWQRCYKKATKICKPRSYEVLEKQRNPKVLFYRCQSARQG